MVGWYHLLNGHEFEQTPGDSEEQVSLACCSPWDLAQMVKNLPEVQETWFQSLVWEDRLEKGMATHSCVLAWRIPGTEEPGGLPSMGLQSRTRLQ